MIPYTAGVPDQTTITDEPQVDTARPDRAVSRPPAPSAKRPAPSGAKRNSSPSRLSLSRRRRVKARKVRRTIRHVDPWSVFKVSIVFFLCMYGALLLAGVLLWKAAVASGLIENVESFMADITVAQEFVFHGDEIFRGAAIGGLVLAVAASAAVVLGAVLFNLISDLFGGIRVSVLEEDIVLPEESTGGPVV